MKHSTFLTAAVAIAAAVALPAAAHGPDQRDRGGYGYGYDHHDDMMEEFPGFHGHGMMAPNSMMGGGMLYGPGMMPGTGPMGFGPFGGMGHFGMSGSMFDQVDENGDGILTPDEARAAHAATLEGFDTDSDGTLSIEEFEKLHSAAIRELMVDRFQFLDADGDGRVTPEEMNAPIDLMSRFIGMQQRFGPLISQPGGGNGIRPRRRMEDDRMPYRDMDPNDMPGLGGGGMPRN